MELLPKKRKSTVKLITLGCAKNEVDSEEIAGVLQNEGYRLDGASNHPDVVIINTCGFLEAAKQESVDTIKSALLDKKRGRVKKIIVAGCLVQRMGKELADLLPGVDSFIGVGQMARFGEIVRNTQASKDRMLDVEPPHHRWAEVGTRARTDSPWSAYLKISEGCDHKCTFCTIPSFRGRHVSKPIERILEEAHNLASNGAKEINLIAQDSTQYGFDLYKRFMLPTLLKEISAVPGLDWIRPLYCYPSRVTDAVIEALATLPNVCKYVDMPLQHADRNILKAMRRPGSSETYLATIEKLRTAIPEIAIRTTFIVGFPGETEESFNTLLQFIQEAQFDRVGAFLYSPETGTPSAAMEMQVPRKVKQERYDRLMTLQQGISLAKNKAWLGREITALIEGFDPKNRAFMVGRSFRDAPEIDGQLFVKNCKASPGEFVRCKVTHAAPYDLFAEAL